jgi:hypothetical protein
MTNTKEEFKPMENYIYPSDGDILLHKKGKYYKVIESHAQHSETQESMVIYQSLETKQVWVRPWSMFTSDRFQVAIKAEDL